MAAQELGIEEGGPLTEESAVALMVQADRTWRERGLGPIDLDDVRIAHITEGACVVPSVDITPGYEGETYTLVVVPYDGPSEVFMGENWQRIRNAVEKDRKQDSDE